MRVYVVFKTLDIMACVHIQTRSQGPLSPSNSAHCWASVEFQIILQQRKTRLETHFNKTTRKSANNSCRPTPAGFQNYQPFQI